LGGGVSKTLPFLGLAGVLAVALAGSGAPARDQAPAPAFAAICAAAQAQMPAGAVVKTAEAVEPAGSWLSPASVTSPDGEAVRVPFCRLAGTIDGDIGFEIWLPKAWNRRLLGAGVGGEAGYFNYADMARAVEQGFVTASSDTGHARGERWIDDPRKAETYSHIAYHRLTEVAKAAAATFYGQPAAYSYFLGCSGGGRQGLRELQLYPGDYDGALIGAPGLDVPLLAARLLHVYLAQARGTELMADVWSLIAHTAAAQCDADDGLADGVVADPRTCAFRVRQLQCREGSSQDCLSPAKVATAESIIAPLSDAQGRTYDYGLLPGITARPGGLPPLPVQMFGDVLHRGSTWDPQSFDIAADLPAARAAFPLMDARHADLGRFAEQGGKLLLYHGWDDPSVQPLSTIDFFTRLQPDAGGFARLYMVPRMQHCRGGLGTDRFGASEDRYPTADPRTDMLAALIAWVERRQAPQEIVARRFGADGAPDRTRPLCPFPEHAVYGGSGSTDEAANFTCTPGGPPSGAALSAVRFRPSVTTRGGPTRDEDVES